MKTTVRTESRQREFGRPSHLVIAIVLAFVLSVAGCVTTDAVSKFATQSSQALAQGQPIFEDLEASCIRAHLAEQAIPANVKDLFDTNDATTAAAAPDCTDYAAVQPGLLATLKVLTDYFTALSQLASTGAASTGKNSSNDAGTAKTSNQTAKTTNLTTDALSAVASLSAFLGRVATSGYQEKHLVDDLKTTDNDVTIVANALSDIVKKRYEDHQLESEENDIQQANLTLLGKTDDSAVRALFRNQWREEVALIATKKAAADAFVKALDNIRDGHKALATETDNLKAKDFPALIQPYTDSLSNLIPALQKTL